MVMVWLAIEKEVELDFRSTYFLLLIASEILHKCISHKCLQNQFGFLWSFLYFWNFIGVNNLTICLGSDSASNTTVFLVFSTSKGMQSLKVNV